MTHRQIVTLLGVLATVVLFGLPLFIELGAKGLGNDEAIYSYAVDRMIEGEDWLTPRSIPQTVTPGDPATRAGEFFEKPPLKFWIVALPIRLGLLPHDAFGLRFWDALFGAVAFVYVFLIGRRLVDPLCGLAAVFLLFIDRALLFSHGLRTNVMEAPLFLAYAAGIYHFLAWSESDRRLDRWLHIFAFAGWFTLGFMTKFVAAIFLPAVVGVTALCLSEWRQRLRGRSLALDDRGADGDRLDPALVRLRVCEQWRWFLGCHLRRSYLRPRHRLASSGTHTTLVLLLR